MLLELLDRLAIPSPITVKGKVQARLCGNDGKRYLWIINHSKESQSAVIRAEGVIGIGKVYWGNENAAAMENGNLSVKVPGKDALVLAVL
jgi:hypothetical protein